VQIEPGASQQYQLPELVDYSDLVIMLLVDKETSEAIREAYVKGGEELAVVELRRFFQIQDDNAARDCAIAIASWRAFSPGQYARQYHYRARSK
jgi:hypothetical protein